MDPAGANCSQLGEVDILGIVLVSRLLGCLLNGAKEEDFPLRKGMSPPWWVRMPEGAGQVGTT